MLTIRSPRAHTTSCAFHASTTLCGPKLRNFSKFPPLLKKAGKANKSHAKTDSSPPVNQAGGPTPTDEIYDMSELESSVLKAIEKLTHDLAQLRSGGRLNPDLVESLKIQLGTASHGKETVRLGDIAQVVPRGRVLNVICGDDAVSRHDTARKRHVLTCLTAYQTHHNRHCCLTALPHTACTRAEQPTDHSSASSPTDR